MKNKLMKARRFFVLGVMAVFVFAGRVGVNAQELSLADEDMQYNDRNEGHLRGWRHVRLVGPAGQEVYPV